MWTTILTLVLMSSVGCYARPQQLFDDRGVPQFWDSAYQFAYAVASPEYGDYHGHQQSMDEYGHTSGSYYLLGADGQWSQTIYADKGLGYQTVYNQRPAGAPPPQVSEVTYQIFVHPGATAISAQGGPGAGIPPQAAQPFGGIRQNSLVDPSIQQQAQGQRFNRETVASQSQILPIGDATIDAAFAPYYESNAVQQEDVYSPRLSRNAEPSPVIYIEEQEPVPEPLNSSSDYDLQPTEEEYTRFEREVASTIAEDDIEHSSSRARNLDIPGAVTGRQ